LIIWDTAANAGLYYKHNFGLVELDRETKPSALITLKVIGADGSTAFEHQITLEYEE